MISATEQCGDLRLMEHEASMAQLTALMRRVHARLEPAQFIEAVTSAFQEERSCEIPEVMDRRFRSEASFQLFRKALDLALNRDEAAQAVLVVGCGQGFAGEPADFAARVTREMLRSEDPRSVATCNLSPAFLRDDPGTFFSAPQFAGKAADWDLVVTHSLLHYVPDLAPVFSLIRRALKPSGGLIVSHEPNARFWKNAECQAAVAALHGARRADRWRKYLNTARLRRWLGNPAERAASISKGVNRRLVERYGLRAPLADSEIRRLVDVHRPEAVPGSFRIGLNGFDLCELANTYLPDFKLVWAGSSGHLGYTDPAALPQKWQREELMLAAKQPLAGSVFTAYWYRCGSS